MIPKVGSETKKNKDTILGQGAQLPSRWGKLLGCCGDSHNAGSLSDGEDLDGQPGVIQQGGSLGKGLAEGCCTPLRWTLGAGTMQQTVNCVPGASRGTWRWQRCSHDSRCGRGGTQT